MKEIPQTVSESTKRRNPHLYSIPGTKVQMTKGGDLYINGQHIIERERPPKRIRQSTKPLMNKLEMEYWGVLKAKYNEGPDHILCQNIRFQLANGLWYKPDFVVFTYAEPVCYEVKGPHAFRGGFENLKMAARLYPFIVWHLVWKQGGQWQSQRVLP